jgi:beta-galactosidase
MDQRKEFSMKRMTVIFAGCLILMAESRSDTLLQARVEQSQGNAVLKINGRDFLPHLFYGGYKLRGTNAAESVFAKQIALTRNAGVQLISSEVQTPWERAGRTDFTAVDRIVQTMIDSAPDAFIYLRFSIDSPPWWNRANPDECTVYADGSTEEGCLASPRWRKEMLYNVTRLLEHCEQKYGDRIAVYHVCGLEYGEWIYPGVWEDKMRGFDPHTRQAFLDWALGRYGSWQRLRKAWNAPDLDSDSFRVPSAEERRQAQAGDFRDPQKEQRTIDYCRFENDLVAETLLIAAGCVKKNTGGRKPVAAFYGYLFETGALPGGPAAGGHYALEQVLRSPFVDLLASPISYGDRSHDGISAFMSPVDSVTANGKLWMVEDDSRTWLCRDDSWPAVYGKVNTPEESIWVHRRNWSHILPRRIGLWHMDLIDDGWFDSPLLWENIGGMRSVYKEHLQFPKSFAPEVAVFIDADGAFQLAHSNRISLPLFSAFRSQLYRIGAPVGFYLLSDLLDGRVPAAKINLFLGAWNLDEAERKALHRTLQDKTAVWFHGSGFMNGTESGTEWMEQLTGFSFVQGAGSGSIRMGNGLASGGPEEFKPLFWQTDHDRRITKAEGRDMSLNPRWSLRPGRKIQELAFFADGPAAAARRSYEGFESIYAGTLGLPAAALRSLCREAGVHVFLDSDDVVSADDHFLSISATTAGEKEIHLPSVSELTDYATQKTYRIGSGRKVSIPFKEGETRLFEYRELP